jgi:hypothetical protein
VVALKYIKITRTRRALKPQPIFGYFIKKVTRKNILVYLILYIELIAIDKF